MARIKCNKCKHEWEYNNEKTCPKCGYAFQNVKKLSFKQKIQQIDPISLLKVDFWSLIGGISGTVLVCILLLTIRSGLWFLIFAFVFSIGLQVSQVIAKYQQIKQLELLKKISSEQVPLEEYLNLPPSKEKILKDIINSNKEV